MHLHVGEIHGDRQRGQNSYSVSLQSYNTNMLARWHLSFVLSHQKTCFHCNGDNNMQKYLDAQFRH